MDKEYVKSPMTRVIRRECRRMLSRPIYLVMTLLLPLFCYSFFVSMMYEGMPMELPIAVVDMDNSNLSRTIIRNLDASPQSRIKLRLNSYHEGINSMQKGEIVGFVFLPRNLQADALTGKQPVINFFTANNYLITGSLVMSDLSTMTALTSASLNVKVRAGKGESIQEIMANVQPIVLDLHTPGNPYINYSTYLSTILSHGLLQIIILLATVYVIGIEIKRGTFLRWFSLANYSMTRAVVGKLIPYTVLFSLMDVAGNTLFFRYLQFPCEGSFFAMLVAGIVMVIVYQAMGVFILGLLLDFKISMTIAGVFGVLGISLSGLTFPIEIMDSPLQGFAWLYPIRYYFLIYIDVALHGLSAFAAWKSWLALFILFLFPCMVINRLKKYALSGQGRERGGENLSVLNVDNVI